MDKEFEFAVDEFIATIREHKTAHAEIMQSDNEESKSRYNAALTRLNEAQKRWRAAFQKPSASFR